MDDLKQWLLKILKIVCVLLVLQVVAIVAMKVFPLLPFAEGCEGAGFACPKGHGFACDELEHVGSAEEIEIYYGWDYMIGGCGWVRMINDAAGCEFTEIQNHEFISATDYNFVSWGAAVPAEKATKEVPLIRFSVGNSYGEIVLPFSGYSCEYGNIGCSGCYSCGVQSWLDGCGEQE